MKKIVILMCSVYLGACASQGQVINLPKAKSEYEWCKPKLLVEYPDIEKYENKYRWELFLPFTENISLRKSLGPPDKTRYSWKHVYPFVVGAAFGSQGGLRWAITYSVGIGGFALLLTPLRVETWVRGNYEIEATVQYTWVDWNGRLVYFNWKEMTKQECK